MLEPQDVLDPPLSARGSSVPSLADAHLAPEPPRSGRAFRPDGSVLLSVSQDKLFRLNGIGTLAWELLAESDHGLTTLELAREMAAIFEAANREGEYRFDVSFERLHADMEKILETSAAQGLLRVKRDTDDGRRFTIFEGVFQNAATASAEVRDDNAGQECGSFGSAIPPSAAQTFMALVTMAGCEAALKVRGFARMFRMLQERKPRPGQTIGPLAIGRICAAVDRAQEFYPKKALCLQRSIVATLLLRRQGVPAEMVVAAKEFPLEAHAWVEVGGRVVNDSQQVQTEYLVMTRL